MSKGSVVVQARTLSAGLLLCNDTEQCCAWLDDPSIGIRACDLARVPHSPSMLCPGDRWQQEEGAWYSFSTIKPREEHQRW